MTVLGKVGMRSFGRGSMLICLQSMDFACVETQIGDGSAADCEIIELDEAQVATIKLPTA